MRARLLVAVVVTAATVLGIPIAAEAREGRVCPTQDFSIGDGWGADRGTRSHMGIDLHARRGTPILAVEDGVINRTKRQDNGALQIVLQGRSGAKFYYGHMDEVLVKGGQRVQGGDVIGTMGDSGSPGSVHLHFEFWRSGGESDAIDPEPLIRRICGR
jgi:murein DD-endopeptidase MepM/ murein hydrolase activator NlpD